MAQTHYETLSIAQTSTQDEIKQAFRAKAHEFHPDVSGGDETVFKQINEAYQILGDPIKRAQYDRNSAAFLDKGFGGTGMDWQTFKTHARMREKSRENHEDGIVGSLHMIGDALGELFDYND